MNVGDSSNAGISFRPENERGNNNKKMGAKKKVQTRQTIVQTENRNWYGVKRREPNDGQYKSLGVLAPWDVKRPVQPQHRASFHVDYSCYRFWPPSFDKGDHVSVSCCCCADGKCIATNPIPACLQHGSNSFPCWAGSRGKHFPVEMKVSILHLPPRNGHVSLHSLLTYT